MCNHGKTMLSLHENVASLTQSFIDDARYYMIIDSVPDFTFEQFVNHLVFWIYKDYYTDNRMSRKNFGRLSKVEEMKEDSSEDLDLYQRKWNLSMKAMEKRKRDDIKRLGLSEEYINKVMRKEKLSGERSEIYHLTDLDSEGINSYHKDNDLKIIRLLSRGTMARSKMGVKGRDISDAYRKYFTYLKDNNIQKEDKDWIEALINLSSIESQSCPALLYAIAKYMQEHNTTRIPLEISMLATTIPTGEKGRLDSRFLHDRTRLIKLFFRDSDKVNQTVIGLIELLKIQRAVLTIVKGDRGMDKLLSSASVNDARIYFTERYNLFSSCSFIEWGSEKEWSPRLIKKYRKVIEVLTEDGHKRSVQVDNEKDVPRSE